MNRLALFGSNSIVKLKRFWTDVINDYKEVAVDTVNNIRTKPAKASKYFTGIGLAVAAIWLNPKEVDFQERHLEANNIMVLVSKPIKNPVSEKHVDHINSLYSDDRIRYTSCLFLSFMWKDNFCREVGLYESQCSYLKPSLRKFYDRIEDIGFWGKWWIYEEKMKDFDVSPAEWSDTSVLNLGVVNPRGFTIS